MDKTCISGSGDLKKRRKCLRKFFVGASGSIVLSVGVAMLVLPGPACVVIPLGLGILSTEFEWARRARNTGLGWLQKHVRGKDGGADRI